MKLQTQKIQEFAYGIYTQKKTYKSLFFTIITSCIGLILTAALYILIFPIVYSIYFLFPDIAFIVLMILILLPAIGLAYYIVDQFSNLETLMQRMLYSAKKQKKNEEKKAFFKRLFTSKQIYQRWVFQLQRIVLSIIISIVLLICFFYAFQSFITPLVYLANGADTQIYVGSVLTFSEMLIDSWGDVLLQIFSGYVILTLGLHITRLYAQSQKWLYKKLFE